MALRLLSDDDVRAVIGADTALELARRVLRDQAEGRAILSRPSAMILDASPVDGPKAKFKAAAVGHLAASGIRLLAHPSPTEKTCNYCAIFKHEDAALSGLVAERWLSRIRTAAFGVASIERLVSPGPLVVALLGAGGIAAEIVPLIARALPVRELRVSSRRPESMSAFAQAHARAAPFPVRAEADRGRLLRDADLVITLTESRNPLVLPGMLKPGAVVCSMGSYNELDYGVLREAERLVVDDADFAAEMGDGAAWIAQGHLTRAQFVERIDVLACEVSSGHKPGRRAATDRIVALVQGMAIGDVGFAAHALRETEKTGRGTLVELP